MTNYCITVLDPQNRFLARSSDSLIRQDYFDAAVIISLALSSLPFQAVDLRIWNPQRSSYVTFESAIATGHSQCLFQIQSFASSMDRPQRHIGLNKDLYG